MRRELGLGLRVNGVGTETKLGFWLALELECGCECEWRGWVDFRANCGLVMSVEKSRDGLQNEAEMAENTYTD